MREPADGGSPFPVRKPNAGSSPPLHLILVASHRSVVLIHEFQTAI
jgi:hypothetical protein